MHRNRRLEDANAVITDRRTQIDNSSDRVYGAGAPENRMLTMKLSKRFVNYATHSAKWAAVLLAGSLFATAVSAQQAAPQQNTPKQPDWQKLCGANQQTKEVVCAITRQLLATTGQVLAAATIQQAEGKNKLLIAVPPTMLLRPGMKVEIDGANEIALTYSICVPNLCFADVDINDEYVASLKRGNNLVVTTANQRNQPLNFTISLAGFTKAYDGPGADPKKLQEDKKKLQDELANKAEEARRKLIEAQQENNQ